MYYDKTVCDNRQPIITVINVCKRYYKPIAFKIYPIIVLVSRDSPARRNSVVAFTPLLMLSILLPSSFLPIHNV